MRVVLASSEVCNHYQGRRQIAPIRRWFMKSPNTTLATSSLPFLHGEQKDLPSISKSLSRINQNHIFLTTRSSGIISNSDRMQNMFFSTAYEESKNPALSSASASTTVPFLLADIGEGIAEVELLQWFVAPGETIAQFDRVCEVQSDKATVEITSRFDGVVEDLGGNEVGDMVKVGSPLLFIRTTGVAGHHNDETGIGSNSLSTLNNVNDEEDKLHIPNVASIFPDFPSGVEGEDKTTSASSITNDTATSPSSRKVLTTPAVRKIGKEHGIDLSTVMGSGPKGRILKSDLLRMIQGTIGSTSITNCYPKDINNVEGSTIKETKTTSSTKEDTEVPIRGYNRLMVNSMTTTLQVPHMCYSDEVDMTSIRDVRQQLKPLADRKGVKLSYLPFAIKACSLAMSEYPVLNASIDVEQMTLTYHGSHDIGIAMDSPRGLVVPVIERCQDRSILEIAEEMNRLQELARKGSLTEADITTPTFTMSNIGAIGGTYMSPVVLPPQVAIGAMGKIQRLPRFVEDSDQVKEVYLMTISWGGDHRVIDGATLGRFSNLWKSYMEMPVSMAFVTK